MAYRDFAEQVAVASGTTAASITLSADPKTQYILRTVVWSVAGTAASANTLTIQYTPAGNPGGGSITITIEGPYNAASNSAEKDIFFGIMCALNTSVTISVTSTGAGSTKLNATYSSVKVQF